MSTHTVYNTPMELCLKNSLLIQKILEFSSDKPVENLPLRLINKRFNQEVLYHIRRTHREVSISFEWSGKKRKEEGSDEWIEYHVIRVNWFAVDTTKLRPLFNFLVNVAGVKVEEFRSVSLYEIYDNKHIHDAFMEVLLKNQNLKVFTGIDDTCRSGCVECERHALSCREYGPLQFDILKDAFKDRKKHFTTLIVKNSVLYDIAKHSTDNSESLEHCMEIMRSLITSNISCDLLQFSLDESNSGRSTEYVPYEIINQMLISWSPKSVRLHISQFMRFDYSTGYRETDLNADLWNTEHFFTRFWFNSPSHGTSATVGILLDYLEIDLDTADASSFSVFGEEGGEEPSGGPLIANARRVFPSRQIMVKCIRRTDFDFVYYPHSVNEKSFKKTVEAVWMGEGELSAPITLRFLRRFDSVEENYEPPQVFSLGSRIMYCKKFGGTIETSYDCYDNSTTTEREKSVEIIGKAFEITDNVSKFSLRLEVYVEKQKRFRKPEISETITWQPKEDFLGRFMKLFLVMLHFIVFLRLAFMHISL